MSRTADWVIQKAFLHAVRKATPPASGTTKYNALIAIVDSMQKLWATDPDAEWDSLYDSRVLSAAAGVGNTIALDADIDHLAKREDDPVLIGTRPFKIVKPNQLYKYRDSDVVAEQNGFLVFPTTIDASLVGQAVTVPAILTVNDIVDGTSIVQVDDPMWLAYASAAEFDRNDIVKVAQYNNILALADQSMQKMKSNNSGSVDEVEMPWAPAGESWV
jgi:hypothetical protein